MWARPGLWTGVPQALLTGRDIHLLVAESGDGRRVDRFVRDPGPVALAFPPPLDPASLHSSLTSTTPYVRVTVDALGSPTAFAHRVWMRTPAGFVVVSLTAARAPLGLVQMTMPAFTGVGAFDPAWGPVTGTDTVVVLDSYASDRPADALAWLLQDGDMLDPPPANIEGLETTVSRAEAPLDLTP